MKLFGRPPGQVLINALTVEVGFSTKMDGKRTYQACSITSGLPVIRDQLRTASGGGFSLQCWSLADDYSSRFHKTRQRRRRKPARTVWRRVARKASSQTSKSGCHCERPCPKRRRGDLLRAHGYRSSNRVCAWVGRESSFLVAAGPLFFITLYLHHI